MHITTGICGWVYRREIGEGQINKSFHHGMRRRKSAQYYRIYPLQTNNDLSLTAAYCSLDFQGAYKAVVKPVPWSANSVFGSAGYQTQQTPPGVAARNFQGPLLFKWCRVEYNKKTNRLEIPKGEYIGKTFYQSRSAESTPKAEDGENYDFIVSCNLDETDSQGEISTHIVY